VIKKVHKKGTAPDPLRGLLRGDARGQAGVVEYEPDSDLRDTEQIPLLEDGGIEAFLRREVLPHAPDAWYVPDSVKTGYEISSPATSTSRSRCGRSPRSGLTSWRWSGRRTGCSPRCSGGAGA
jgi:hypothetical protein